LGSASASVEMHSFLGILRFHASAAEVSDWLLLLGLSAADQSC